jgi:hypothetical protein
MPSNCHGYDIGAHPHRYLYIAPDAPPSHVAYRLPRGGQGGGCFLTMATGTGFQTTCRWMGLQALPMAAPPWTRVAAAMPCQAVKYVEHGNKVTC